MIMWVDNVAAHYLKKIGISTDLIKKVNLQFCVLRLVLARQQGLFVLSTLDLPLAHSVCECLKLLCLSQRLVLSLSSDCVNMLVQYIHI